MLNADAFAKMRDGVMIVNTSRGELLNSKDAIEALKSSKIGSLGIDVYENEKDLFFEDKVQRRYQRRCIPPPVSLPQRLVYRPPGFLDRRGSRQHR